MTSIKIVKAEGRAGFLCYSQYTLAIERHEEKKRNDGSLITLIASRSKQAFELHTRTLFIRPGQS